MQAPAWQTPVPPPGMLHGRPSRTGVAVGVQVGVPDPHSFSDCTQASAGVQSCPCTQLTQPPVPSHTRSVPHADPGGSKPASAHTSDPVPQAIVPAWQVIPGSQAVPAVHGTQAPLASQTRFEPQAVPAATWLCTQLAPVIASHATAPV